MSPGFSIIILCRKGTTPMKASNKTHQMALIGLMTAILCIMAPFSILLPFSPIPLSLGTLAIYFCVLVLGMKKGTLSVVLYLLLGLVGLPVFSGFTGGIGKLLGPTGGYIVGYVLLALVCGFFADRFPNRKVFWLLGILLGTALCYLFGTLWLSYQASLTFSQALLSSVVPFLPGDMIKIALALPLGLQIRKRLPL